jgi:hypothetical protein
MTDRYGFIDARYYDFECALDGEDVSTRCARGYDLSGDGWVDLYPADEEGHITSVDTERHHGEVVFTHVVADRQSLSILAINELSKLKQQVNRLERALEVLAAEASVKQVARRCPY